MRQQPWWWKVRDWHVDLRTRGAIAERECRHDGSAPECTDCIRNSVGW